MNIALYFSLVAAFPIIDSIWLYSMGGFYKKWLGHIFDSSFHLAPAAIFYLIYAAALMHFVAAPALRQGTALWAVFLSGALFGLAAYGAYDLTNQATIKNWPVIVTVVDLAWGAVLSGLVSVIVVALFENFR